MHSMAIWTWLGFAPKAKPTTLVELMVGKLRGLPDTTQEALKQLACPGNVAEIDTLSLFSANQKTRSTRRSWRPSAPG